ncbi:MAG: hypothetical protein HY862_15885 [Chloroflexi bacterium]|nr:hypothetical protein [Chloroflexota bacterium]
MAKDVQFRQDGKIGFLDFPRDVIAQTRESAYAAYNQLSVSKVDIVAMNFETSDYLNSAGIGLVISLVEDANRAGRRVFAYGLSSHYRKLFSMVGLTERLSLVPNEQAMRDKLNPPPPPEEVKKEENKS